MRIVVHAVGRMKAGPERELAGRYFDRFAKAGASLGFDFAGVIETPESRAHTPTERKREEAARLGAHIADGALLVLLDERGEKIGSDAFASRLAGWRDSGRKGIVVVIGGPDGHDSALRDKADAVLSFGALTFPHQIVRILLAEQLYRAATILAGHPYHRS